jgi:hypothetical protein
MVKRITDEGARTLNSSPYSIVISLPWPMILACDDVEGREAYFPPRLTMSSLTAAGLLKTITLDRPRFKEKKSPYLGTKLASI